MAEFTRIIETPVRELQTAIQEWHQPDTDSNVSLVAMLHFGTPEYYEAIRNYVADRHNNGAHVYYELVRNADQQDIQAAGPEIQRAITRSVRAQHFALDGVHRLMSRGLGLISQGEGLPSEATWENHDLNSLQLAQRLAPTRLDAYRDKKIGVLLRLIPPFLAKRAASYVLTYEGHPQNNFENSAYEQVIINARSAQAMKAMDERRQAQPDSGFVMLWGSDHMQYFSDELAKRTYEQTGEAWLTAAKLD